VKEYSSPVPPAATRVRIPLPIIQSTLWRNAPRSTSRPESKGVTGKAITPRRCRRNASSGSGSVIGGSLLSGSDEDTRILAQPFALAPALADTLEGLPRNEQDPPLARATEDAPLGHVEVAVGTEGERRGVVDVPDDGAPLVRLGTEGEDP